VRLGLIGTGLAVRRLHWPALAALRERFEVVGFADPDRDAAAAFAGAAGLGMEGYAAEAPALLARPEVEAVLVAVPLDRSYDVAEAALAAGKHVLCEKPAGASVEEGRAFLALERRYAREGERVLLIGENFLYRDDLRHAAALVAGGAIGAPRLVDFRFVRRTSEAPGEFASTEWRRRPVHRGGIHLDVGVHHVAQLRRVCGEPVAVQAVQAGSAGAAGGAAGARETYPALLAHLRFAGGATGAYQAVYDATTDRPGATMRVYGDGGTLELEGDAVRVLRAGGSRTEQRFAHEDGGYRNEWLDFYGAVREGRRPVGTVAQSFRNVLIVARMLDAAASGGTVAIESEGMEACGL
jgi:predicted dehydrogenase